MFVVGAVDEFLVLLFFGCVVFVKIDLKECYLSGPRLFLELTTSFGAEMGQVFMTGRTV